MTPARWALYLWGFSLPFVSFAGEKVVARDLSSRFTAADLCGVLVILLSLPAGRWLRPNAFFPALSAGFLLFVAAVSSSLVVLMSASVEPLSSIAAPWLILAFLVVLSARASALLRGERDVVVLMCWVAAGGLVESFIVGHDLVARFVGAAMWFRDPMDLRMRGTFRASGQLAQYGFVVGAVLFALSAWPGLRARTRLWCSLTAAFLALYPVFTTRRSGIGALAVLLLTWIALSRLYGTPGVRKALPVLVPAGLLLLAYLGQAEYRSFLVGRVAAASQRVAPGEGFLVQQALDAGESLAKHPFFGVGWGLSESASRSGNEMHSTYLAVLVDAGLAGALAFCAFIGDLLFRCWRFIRLSRGTPHLELAIRFFAALVAQLAFWVHNRGLRDRGFFLFLAVFAACAQLARARAKEEPAR